MVIVIPFAGSMFLYLVLLQLKKIGFLSVTKNIKFPKNQIFPSFWSPLFFSLLLCISCLCLQANMSDSQDPLLHVPKPTFPWTGLAMALVATGALLVVVPTPLSPSRAYSVAECFYQFFTPVFPKLLPPQLSLTPPVTVSPPLPICQ